MPITTGSAPASLGPGVAKPGDALMRNVADLGKMPLPQGPKVAFPAGGAVAFPARKPGG